MARNRVIYQSEAVYVCPNAGGTPVNLKRVQSCNYNFSIERTDVNQFGELAAIDRLILQEPTVNVDLSYIFEPSAANETNLGLSVGSAGSNNILSGIVTHTGDPSLNIIIGTSNVGVDAAGAPVSYCIGIGNAFLTSWSLEAAVGGFPTVTCAFEGQNIGFEGGSGIANPSFNSAGVLPGGTINVPSATAFATTEVPAIKPGDVTIALTQAVSDPNANTTPALGLSESDLKVQSVTVAMTMSREPLRKLGRRSAFSRELTFPITCTMSVNAVVGDIVAGKLNEIFLTLGGDAAVFDCTLTLLGAQVASPYTTSSRMFTLKKAKLNSQNITSSIGPNKSVTLELSAQIGKDSGLFMA